MRNSIKLSAVLAFLAAIAAPTSAAAQGSAKEVRDYWTPERMQAAIPGDALLPGAPEGARLVPGDLGFGLDDTAERRRASANRVSRPGKPRFRKHGKVFFSDGGLNYVCSGTSAKAKTKSLVLTAGHCTHSQNGYVNNFMFAPAYDDGNTPYGEFTAKKIKATDQWVSSEDIRYDVGMATVGKSKGKKLANAVGSRSLAFNREGNLNYDVIGYPAADPYDGESMYKCETRGDGTDRRQKNPEPTRVDCPQTGGSSGGGWVLDSGKLNSVVSYGYECVGTLPIDLFPTPPTCNNTEEGKLFGPYFGKVIKDLYRSQRR